MTLTMGMLDTLIRGNSQSSSRRLQVLAAPSLAWLEMTSLSPLVPGVDEQQRLFSYLQSFGVPVRGFPAIHNLMQPPLKDFWRRVDKNRRALLSPGTIVPGRKYTWNPPISWSFCR